MAKAADLKNLNVDELLSLRAEVVSALAEKARELERQIALLNGSGGGKKRGRPAAGNGGGGRVSAMRGMSVPPKYRGPDGETWAGRGATPRWLKALIAEGHSVEEYAIGGAGGETAAAAVKTPKKRGRKPGGKKGK